jgi:mRNA interferase RelE/StbE
MNWKISSVGMRFVKKISKPELKRIFDKLDWFCSQKNTLSFADHLTKDPFGEYRFRVGDYRIIFDVSNDTAWIHKIGHRKDIYK